MEWSSWRAPRSVGYWTDSGIEFTDGDSVLDRASSIISQQYLTGTVLTDSREVRQLGSRGLIFTDFGFASGAVAEIELSVVSSKLARIIDQRVQLYLTEAIGNNLAREDSENHQTYSGDLVQVWGVSSVAISDPGFGVLLDFAPRPDMPSSNPLIIHSVSMRVLYS